MNESVHVKAYESDKPLIRKIESLIKKSLGDCHNKYFHTFDHICEYLLNFTIIGNNGTVIFKISAKSMGLYNLNKKLGIA